jgi:short-subunit dehydrogenase
VSCPGPTATDFFKAAEVKPTLLMLGELSAGVVARDAYRAMHAGQPLVIHGLQNRLIAASTRVTPRFILRALVALLNRPPPTWALKARG